MKAIFLFLGILCFIIGSIGVFVPILPSFIFYVLTIFFFARSSEKLEAKFRNSNLYKKNVLPALNHKDGWTIGYKIKLIISLTLTMGIGFYFSRRVLLASIIIAIIYTIHIIFFIFVVKTKRK